MADFSKEATKKACNKSILKIESGYETLSAPTHAERNMGLFSRNGKVTNYGVVQRTLLLVQCQGETV